MLLVLLASDGGILHLHFEKTPELASKILKLSPSFDAPYFETPITCSNFAIPRVEQRPEHVWLICDARKDGGR